MPTEILYLIASVGLYGVMILMQTAAATLSKKASVNELVGPRDDLPAQGLTPLHGRTKRAQANMTEAMIMFTPLVLIAVQMNALSAMTALVAALFFYARLAFAPLYYFGVPWLRTLAWLVSMVGILMIFFELVL